MSHTTTIVRPVIKFTGMDDLVWANARSAATVDEGAALSYTISLNWMGHTQVPVFFRIRQPGIVSDQPVIANDGDFDSPLVEAIRAAVLAKGGEFSIRPSSFFVAMPAGWDGTLVIPRTALNNPAEQGDRLSGLEIFGFSHGGGSTLIQGITVHDLTTAPSVPVNSVAPSLSGDPVEGQAVSLNFGLWTPAGSAIDYSDIIWQKQVSDQPLSFYDSFNRNDEIVTNDPRYSLLAGTANLVTVNLNGVAFGAGAGTIVLAEDCGDTSHWASWIQKGTSGGRKRIYIKVADASNNIYFREGASNFEVYVMVGGSPQLRISAARSLIIGDQFYLECLNNVVTLKRNGAVVGTPYTLSPGEQTAIGAATDIGFGTDINATSIAFDDFRHGGFTTGGPPVAILIEGATLRDFVPTFNGVPIRGGVRPRNSAGQAADYVFTSWSANIAAAPSASPPVNTTAPSFSSTAAQAGVENPMSVGVWTNNPTLFRLYVRRDSAGSPTAGPLTPPVNYVPTSADVGHTLQPGCDASNDGGATWTAIAWGTATNVVTAAGGGTLTGLAFGPVGGPSVLWKAPANTRVAEVIGIGATLTSLAFVAAGDAEGRFKITEESGRFYIDTTGSPLCDFEGAPNASGFTRGVIDYTISLNGNNTVQAAFKIRPFFPRFNIRGDTTNTIIQPSFTSAGLRSAINSTTPFRTVKVSPSNTGVILNTSGAQDWLGNDRTIIGHPHFVYRTDELFKINAKRTLVKDLVWYPGAKKALTFVGSGGRDVDVCTIGHNGIASQQVVDLQWENVTCGGNNDEMVTLISGSGPFVRSVRFVNVAFVDPLACAGNPKGEVSQGGNPLANFHNYGPLCYNGSMNVLYEFCFIYNCSTRAPLLKGDVKGITFRNNVCAYVPGRGNGGCIENTYDPGGTIPSSGVIEANLLHLISAEARAEAILFRRLPSGSKWYVPQSGERSNQFINALNTTQPDFVPRAITVGAGLSLIDGTPSSILTSYRPFDREDDDEVWPVGTEALNRALWERVILYCGARLRDANGNLIPGVTPAICGGFLSDILTPYYTNGSRRANPDPNPNLTDEDMTPPGLDRLYGDDWSGGICAATGLPGANGSMARAA